MLFINTYFVTYFVIRKGDGRDQREPHTSFPVRGQEAAEQLIEVRREQVKALNDAGGHSAWGEYRACIEEEPAFRFARSM